MKGISILFIVYSLDKRCEGWRRAFPGAKFLPLFEVVCRGRYVPREVFAVDVVVWMYVPQNEVLFRVLQKKIAAKQCLYQYDEPHIRRYHPSYQRLLPYFHRTVGTSHLLQCHTLPLIDTSLFLPLSTPYICDISLIITTLYSGKEQWLPRLEFIGAMEGLMRRGVVFHLYGPPSLRHLPGYQRMLRYDELPNAICASRINVSLHLGNHAFNRQQEYVNERCLLAMACGGLLLVDSCNSRLMLNGVNCLEIDKEGIERQVFGLLKRYSSNPRIRAIKRRARQLALRYNLSKLRSFL